MIKWYRVRPMLILAISMIFLIILVTCQMFRIIDNKVTLFIKPMGMDHKISLNSMIIQWILLALENRFMLSMIFHITLVTCQTFKTTDSNLTPFTKQMDMDLKTSQNNMIILKIQPGLASKFTLNNSMIFLTTLVIYQMSKIIDSKVIPSTKQMVTVLKI